MGKLGFVLFSIGIFLTAAYASFVPVVDEGATGIARISAWFEVGGIPFLIGLVLMLVGAVLARRDKKSASTANKTKGQQRSPLELLADYENSFSTLLEKLQKDEQGKVKVGLEDLVEEKLPLIWEQREAILTKMGLENFAEFAGSLSSMERNAARAWSAIIDDVWNEVEPSLARASDSLSRAKELAESTL